MTQLTFRQGVVRHQIDTLGQQGFLNSIGGNVSLVISDEYTVISFIDGSSDYLFTESSTVPNAWGPFSPGMDRWLYWDLNQITGVRTFGFTTSEPVEQSIPPTTPNTGQMWFNTVTNIWSEFNGTQWLKVIRVFACKLDVGLVPRSMSMKAPDFRGTQVGLTQSVRSGGLVFDKSGKPIKTDDGKFFTTEDAFTSGVPTGASLRINNVVLSGQAQQPFSRSQVVELTSFDRLIPASPYSQGQKIFGVVEEDYVTNEVAQFVIEGIIFDSTWDWVDLGAEVNDPVYISLSGEFQLTAAIPEQLPVGSIIGRQEIIFAPRLFPQVDIAGGSGGVTQFVELLDVPNSYIGQSNKFVKVNGTESDLEFVTDPGYLLTVSWGDIIGDIVDQTDLGTTLSGKSDSVHIHTKSDITDFAHSHSKSEISDFVEGDYATSAQGTLADSSVQPSDNISTLTNDAGYLTSYTETDPVFISQKGVANGVATLDATGLVPTTQIPPLAITDTFVINNEPSMLAIAGQTGDVAIRTDESKTYILQGNDPSVLGDWKELLTPTSTGIPYDVSGMVFGVPADGAVVLRHSVVRAFTIETTGHTGYSGIAATAATAFDISVNGSSIGTMNFAMGATVATFSVALATAISAGDKIEFTAPVTADATLGEIGFTLFGNI